MNYFAHGYRHLNQPWRLAGTALPDWLNVIDRRTRARSKKAALYLDSPDEAVRELAIGVIQHHHDDRWFHGQPDFLRLNHEFATDLRQICPADDSPRSSFVGHICVELLLDAELIRRDEAGLESYYATVQELDLERLSEGLAVLLGKPVPRIRWWVERFSAEQFLRDYAENAPLARRLNQVLHRVGLPPLPATVTRWLESARVRVAEACDRLFPPPPDAAELAKVVALNPPATACP
jgi:hypothetical protein